KQQLHNVGLAYTLRGAKIIRMSTMRPLLVLLILQGRLSLLLVVEATCAVNNSIDEEEIVGALLDPKQYNKNHRPLNRWTGQAASNNSRNHQNMDFTVNIYLRMIWEDARLAYSASNPNASVSLHSMKDKIWMPDIFFRNAKQSVFCHWRNDRFLIRKAGSAAVTALPMLQMDMRENAN
uniref:Neur_chan_LBD domain-containing protein n=1 Tax=Macrostomum lignano TaxID=282301 RepID=A0A1I8IXJ1_9PLAT